MMSHEQYLLIKLAEEASEVAQIALKTAQFGMLGKNPELAENNQQRIHGELNDLLAIVDGLNNNFNFGFKPNVLAKMAKIQKVYIYMGYSKQLGMVK